MIKPFHIFESYSGISEDEWEQRPNLVGFNRLLVERLDGYFRDKEYYSKIKVFAKNPETGKPLWQNWSEYPYRKRYDWIFGWILADVDDTSKLVNIFRMDDEWFYIRVISHIPDGFRTEIKLDYYRCDQLEGVIGFLTDKKII